MQEVLMTEIWKDVMGYEGLYQVSTFGNVKRVNTQKLRQGTKNKEGYLNLSLHKHGKRGYFRINRLVAQAFIPNPENKPQVNHKNGIKADNRAENLEWCTGKENVLHSFKTLGRIISNRKQVRCIELNIVFESVKAAARYFNCSRANIINFIQKSKVRGYERKSARGYQWEYVKD